MTQKIEYKFSTLKSLTPMICSQWSLSTININCFDSISMQMISQSYRKREAILTQFFMSIQDYLYLSIRILTSKTSPSFKCIVEEVATNKSSILTRNSLFYFFTRKISIFGFSKHTMTDIRKYLIKRK